MNQKPFVREKTICMPPSTSTTNNNKNRGLKAIIRFHIYARQIQPFFPRNATCIVWLIQIFSKNTHTHTHLTYDSIRFDSFRDSLLYRANFHDNRQYCALCIGSKQNHVQCTCTCTTDIYVSSLAYAPIFVLANSPNGINKSNIFQTRSRTGRTERKREKRRKSWMRVVRWRKINWELKNKMKMRNQRVRGFFFFLC